MLVGFGLLELFHLFPDYRRHPVQRQVLAFTVFAFDRVMIRSHFVEPDRQCGDAKERLDNLPALKAKSKPSPRKGERNGSIY
jgi:hypothetical protein